uniref:RNA-directed DNA polymerase n=1 Tax=Caenorhabditis japonica TaxID=281687 RepID=A0A8R1E486_CAEJA
MFALRRFKTIVYGTRVVVCTDHKPLISLLKGSPLADRLLRWSLEILEFNVKIVYVAGKANVVADALSRGGALGVDSTEGETTELTNVINEVRTACEKDDILNTENWFEYLRQEDEGWKVVVEQLENGERQGVLKIVGVKGGVNLHDFCLIGKSLRNIENPSHSRRVVPMCAREALIKEYHEGALAGHFGTEKLMRQLSKKFMWTQMRSSIEKIVKACSKCICRNDYPKMVAPLTPYRTSYPLEIVACDLIDVGLSIQGNRYALTILDLFTKYGIAVPIPDKKAETVFKAFAERWAVGEGRIPHTLLTDQGKEFANGLFEQFNTMLKIKHVMTKGYNSRANGAVERFNKTIMHIVKKKVALPIKWDDQLPYAVYAYNSIAHRTTGDTPYFLMTGRDPQGPLIMEGEDAGGMNYSDMEDYKCVLTHELLVAHKKAKEHARSEWKEYKRLFDSKHKVHSRKYPQPGSRVLVEIPSEKLGARCPKLVNKWKGPYRVVTCSENSVTVRPVMGKSKETLVIPFDNVRVIPAEMENIAIETKKGRMRVKTKELNCDNVVVPSVSKDMLFFREIYCCRCHTPCNFHPPGLPKIRTTSPIQLFRIVTLLKRHPELRDCPQELQLLSKHPIPHDKSTPDVDTILSLSSCPTILLTVKGVPLWETAFEDAYSAILKKALATPLRKKEVWTLLMPSVCETVVPIQTARMIKWGDVEGKFLETLHGTRCDAILIVAHVLDLNHLLINRIKDALPPEIVVILVGAPAAIDDYARMEQLEMVFDQFQDEGVIKLSPGLRVQSHKNRKLLEIGDSEDVIEYWKAVEQLAKDMLPE